VEFRSTDIEGLVLVVPEPRADERGAFARAFCREEFGTRGLMTVVAQTNVANTVNRGTVRGLHYQLPPAGEAKLLRCTNGAVFDVAVDLRAGSDSFGRWFGVELSAEDGIAVHVPSGCAHGYQTLTDGASVLYEVSTPYTPELERGIIHADHDLAIDWPLPPRDVSAKDLGLPTLAQAELPNDDSTG
jgi:dTDP-4-dehydrorhamnose 3,5-epimerase